MAIAVNENKTGVLSFWERPGAFVLNSYGVQQNASVFAGTAVAYSLRIPAGSSYNGPLIRVRRSSDNAEADFGAVWIADGNGNRWLDTVALLTFVGAGTGYVTTWYDQSGSARNATQATAANQPTIVTSGVLNVVNNRPVVIGTSTSALSTSSAVTAKQMVTTLTMPTTSSDYQTLCAPTTNAAATAAYATAYSTSTSALTGGGARVASGLFLNGSTPSYTVSNWNSFASPGLSVSGAAAVLTVEASSVTASSSIALFADPPQSGGARNWRGGIQEFTLFGSLLSTVKRQTLERSQGTAFGITVA